MRMTIRPTTKPLVAGSSSHATPSPAPARGTMKVTVDAANGPAARMIQKQSR